VEWPSFYFSVLQLIFKISTPIFWSYPLTWPVCRFSARMVPARSLLTRVTRSKRPTRLGASLPTDGSRTGFWNVMFLKISLWAKSRKRRLFHCIATLFQRLVYLAQVSTRVYLPHAAWSLWHHYHHSCICPLDVTNGTDCAHAPHAPHTHTHTRTTRTTHTHTHTHFHLHAGTVYRSPGNTTTNLSLSVNVDDFLHSWYLYIQTVIYTYVWLNDGDTFWEMRR